MTWSAALPASTLSLHHISSRLCYVLLVWKPRFALGTGPKLTMRLLFLLVSVCKVKELSKVVASYTAADASGSK